MLSQKFAVADEYGVGGPQLVTAVISGKLCQFFSTQGSACGDDSLANVSAPIGGRVFALPLKYKSIDLPLLVALKGNARLVFLDQKSVFRLGQQFNLWTAGFGVEPVSFSGDSSNHADLKIVDAAVSLEVRGADRCCGVRRGFRFLQSGWFLGRCSEQDNVRDLPGELRR